MSLSLSPSLPFKYRYVKSNSSKKQELKSKWLPPCIDTLKGWIKLTLLLDISVENWHTVVVFALLAHWKVSN